MSVVINVIGPIVLIIAMILGGGGFLLPSFESVMMCTAATALICLFSIINRIWPWEPRDRYKQVVRLTAIAGTLYAVMAIGHYYILATNTGY